MGSLFTELKRRNVFRVGVFYAIAAWLIMQVVDIVLPALNLPEWTITLVIVLLAIGLPVALIFAWAFELTPDGLKREKEVDRSASITSQTGRRMDRVIIGLLSIALVYMVINYVVLGPDSSPEQAASQSLNSIAVLPFVDMSQQGDQEYFADGISEELLNVLAKVREFRVAGRTSSFAFKGQNQDIREIGRLLNVEAVLEGSIRRSGEQVRVTAQLVDVDDGFHLWSDTYDRKLENIFQIQDEIARAVVAALKTTLLGEEALAASTAAPAPVSTEAYELFLKGRHAWHQRTPEALAEAMEFFKEAIALDPAYAPAWSGLADTWLLSIDYSDMPKQEGLREGKRAIDTALRLDPDLADGYASLGLYYQMDFELDDAVVALRKTIELNPSHAMANMWLANALSPGSPESLAQLEIAREIDPLHPVILGNYARNLFVNGQEARSLEVAEDFKRLYPDSGDPDVVLGQIAMWANRPVDAVFHFEDALRKSPSNANAPPMLAILYLLFEDENRAQSMIDLIGQRFPNSFANVYQPTALFMRRGKYEEAGRHLAKMYELRPDLMPLRCFRNLANLALRRNLETVIGDCEAVLAELPPEVLIRDGQVLPFILARALTLHGQDEKAGIAYEQHLTTAQAAIDLESPETNLRDVHVDRARTYIELGRQTEAVEAFRAALDEGLLFARLENVENHMGPNLGDVPAIRELAEEVEQKVAAMKAEIESRRAARAAQIAG